MIQSSQCHFICWKSPESRARHFSLDSSNCQDVNVMQNVFIGTLTDQYVLIRLVQDGCIDQLVKDQSLFTGILPWGCAREHLWINHWAPNNSCYNTPAVLRTSVGPQVQQIPQQQSRDWNWKEGIRYSERKLNSKQDVPIWPTNIWCKTAWCCIWCSIWAFVTVQRSLLPSFHPLHGVGSATQTDSWTPSA